ncbi:MAG: ChbG/HpnK family deacetylase [Eubacteriales bacterium]|nr:ChbG/HpnK family deacetylase [Eubacteriales bacterium]
MSLSVIINADDLGLNPVVNNAIDEALAKGVITSSTILANSKYLNDVKDIIRKNPAASYGIHLDLTEGSSFTNNPLFITRGIIDDNGCFIHGNSKRCSNADEELKEAIRLEWNAQIEHLLHEGFDLSHVDGHHHCHTWYGLQDVLVGLMAKYNLTKARNCYRYPIVDATHKLICLFSCFLVNSGIFKESAICANNQYFSHISGACRNYQHFMLYNNALESFNIGTTDYFGAYEDFYKLIRRGFKPNGNYAIELMCHPGLPAYKEEVMMVLQDAIGVKQSDNFQLISYKEL